MVSDRLDLASTTSLCPTCLERVPGQYEAVDGSVRLTRTCPTHGTTTSRVWGSVDHWEWAADYGPSVSGDGDLIVDNDHACLAVVDVTHACNLHCSYCFAGSGPGDHGRSFEDVVHLLEVIKDAGGPRPIQFSGGEPTIRPDLPELIEVAHEKGFEHVQVNTNGLMLAADAGLAARLSAAGATAVYLQFDGLERSTYEAIREVDILDEKFDAIDRCRAAELPVVLVPTIVPGVNEHEMGPIVRFALDNLDVVQSVNFQPVAHFGRYADHSGRFSLDLAAEQLTDQLAGVRTRDVMPIPCCSAYCQMATALLRGDDGTVIPLTRFIDTDRFETLAGLVDEADWMELLAGTVAGEECTCSAAGCCGFEPPSGGSDLLSSILPVSLTGFMDADAADVDRLSNCCIAVPTPSGELVPFCAYNMTDAEGGYALRTRHGWGGRPAIDAPVADGLDRADNGGKPQQDRARTDGGGGRSGGHDIDATRDQ